MITLNESKYAKFYEKYDVVVDGVNQHYTHIYVTPEGGFLPGVTKMIKNHLFPRKYNNIPESVLMAAADRGHKVHTACEGIDKIIRKEMILETGNPVMREAIQYDMLRSKVGMFPLANEYCVSLPDMASCIDCVWEKNGEVYLADIKTTYELDKEYLSWQLSLYAYMFELQNPDIKVKGLYGVWLYKGQEEKTKLVEIERKPDALIEKLLECERNGVKYMQAPVAEGSQNIVAQSIVDEVYELLLAQSMIEERVEEFKKFVKGKMEEKGMPPGDFGKFRISYTKESTSMVFDSAKFKKENPELAEKYMKEQKRSASLRITLR